jgi:hypothetical protein
VVGEFGDEFAELRLSRSERAFGALALALAEGMDASPPYAKGKLARELREVLTRLEQAEVSPPTSRSCWESTL